MEPQLQSLWSSSLINKVHRLEQLQKENTALCSEPRAECEPLCNLGKQVINCFNPEAHKYKSILLETKPNICNFFFQTFSRQRIWHRTAVKEWQREPTSFFTQTPISLFCSEIFWIQILSDEPRQAGIFAYRNEAVWLQKFTGSIRCLFEKCLHAFHFERSSVKQAVWIPCRAGRSITFLQEDAGRINSFFRRLLQGGDAGRWWEQAAKCHSKSFPQKEIQVDTTM